MSAALLVALGVVTVVAVRSWALKLGVAAPLLLLAFGVVISFFPAMPPVEVEPEWILAGVLPPLLYASAVSLPAMDFRRDFSAIGGLSVVLVGISSLSLGAFFSAVVPGIDLATGVALGAVASPTDAVAISIVRRVGVPARLVTVLEGESLLNDATALVVLRAALAAGATSLSFWSVAGDFVWAVVVAVAIGVLVGQVNLRLRSRLRDESASTAISFVVPFVASVPAEHFGASGLVAAVAAGLVTGQGAARHLRPQDRLASSANWATLELLLEGGIFLLMGLELSSVIGHLGRDDGSLGLGLGLGAGAILLAIVVRALYVTPLLWLNGRRAIPPEEARRRVEQFQTRASERAARASERAARSRRRRSIPPPKDWTRNIQRYLADVDYIASQPLGPKEGVVLVWAGMRGAITLAAAQSLPVATPKRELLVFTAFVTAAGSLVLQGATLRRLVRLLGLGTHRDNARAEAALLADSLARTALGVIDDPALRRADGATFDERVIGQMRLVVAQRLRVAAEDPSGGLARDIHEVRLRIIAAQREVLLDARETGTFGSEALNEALDLLDADQIGTEMKLGAEP